jgi:flavorubredoxin
LNSGILFVHVDYHGWINSVPTVDRVRRILFSCAFVGKKAANPIDLVDSPNVEPNFNRLSAA